MQVSRHRRAKSTDGRAWLCIEGEPVVRVKDLTCILDELRARRGTRGTYMTKENRAAPLTIFLTEMEEGETKVWPEVLPGNRLTAARRTARRRLINDKAVWISHADLDAGQTTITRMPDGSDPYQHLLPSPKVIEIAKMAVGDTKILHLTTYGSRLSSCHKYRARQLMNEPQANWKSTRLANGTTKIVRTA